jgi:uncharacterized peroxidase-related enzyme
MAFIDTIPPDAADGDVAAMYETDRAAWGFLPNFTRAYSHRPDVYAAWKGLNGAVKANMDERRYEIATLAAARRLRSSYCSLAHGRVLARLIPASVVQDIALGRPSDELDEVDMAVIDLADKVATDATTVTQADIERLRGLGLADAEILDVVLAAAARCFFSKVLDAVGCDPDAAFNELEPGLRAALTVGRPIAADAGEMR